MKMMSKLHKILHDARKSTYNLHFEIKYFLKKSIMGEKSMTSSIFGQKYVQFSKRSPDQTKKDFLILFFGNER